MKEFPQATILGVRVFSMTGTDVENYIASVIRARGKSLVLNVNAHALNLACQEPWLRDFFNQAAVVFPDGHGAVWAGRMLGIDMDPRVTYADWFYDLAALAERQDFSLYFLGARPGVAKAAQYKLEQRYSGIRIVGSHHGYFEKAPNSTDNQKVINEINLLKPDILVVALGMPLQERWLKDNWNQIDAHAALTGGAVFDYVSGGLKRPPRLLTDHGFEWLGRLLIEPGRLWKRYLLGNPKFVWRVLQQRFGTYGWQNRFK